MALGAVGIGLYVIATVPTLPDDTPRPDHPQRRREPSPIRSARRRCRGRWRLSSPTRLACTMAARSDTAVAGAAATEMEAWAAQTVARLGVKTLVVATAQPSSAVAAAAG